MTLAEPRTVVLVGPAPRGAPPVVRGPLVVVAIGWPLTATQRAVVDGLQREADARGHRFDGHVVASVRDAAALLGAGDDVHALLARRDARRLRRLSVSVRDAR